MLFRSSQRRAKETGDDLPVTWLHRDERYVEKLSTPDTSVADLIGDVDPVRVAEGRRLGDPETIHYGLVPRANRGIRSEEHTSELQSRGHLVCRLLLEKKPNRRVR